MHVTQRTQEMNPGKLTLLFRKQFEMCQVKKGETIACLSDLSTRRSYIESAFAAAEDQPGAADLKHGRRRPRPIEARRPAGIRRDRVRETGQRRTSVRFVHRNEGTEGERAGRLRRSVGARPYTAVAAGRWGSERRR